VLEPVPGSQRTSHAGPRALFELGAVYHDPRSSAVVEVGMLVFEGGQVVITGAGVDVECAASALRFEAPVLGASVSSVRLPSGAQCVTADLAALTRLRELGGRPLPFARVYALEQSWAAVVLAAAFVLTALVASYVWVIPSVALRVVQASPRLKQKVGQGTLAIVDRWLEPSRLSASEREHVRALFAPLAADYPGLGLHLEFRSLGAPNAFALPDGTVVLTDEIIRLAQHDDALTGVLLHEIGHVTHGHSLRRIIESSTFAVLAAAYYGDADQITAIAGGLPLVYANSRYSRRDETEADGVALDGLLRLRKDPRHVAALFRAMEVRAQGSDLEYFSSHPATAKRAEVFEAAGRE
jgi:Zn-dependent protease with chaperone function